MEHKIEKLNNLFCQKYLDYTSLLEYDYNKHLKSTEKFDVHAIVSQMQRGDARISKDDRVLLEALASCETATQAALRDTESTRCRIQELVESIEKMTVDLVEERAKCEADLRAVNEPLELITKWLSLSIKKLSDDELEIRFTSINHLDPLRVYCLSLSTDHNNQYIVKDREGADNEFDVLVENLNQTNQLREFLVKARQRYVKLAKLDEPSLQGLTISDR